MKFSLPSAQGWDCCNHPLDTRWTRIAQPLDILGHPLDTRWTSVGHYILCAIGMGFQEVVLLPSERKDAQLKHILPQGRRDYRYDRGFEDVQLAN